MLKPNIALIADRDSLTELAAMSLDLYTRNIPLTQKARFWGNYVSALKGDEDTNIIYNPINPNPYSIKATLTYAPPPRPASALSTRASRRRSPPITRTSGLQLSTKASQFSEKAFLLKADILCSACVDSMCLNAHLPKCFNSILHCKYCEIFAKFR